MCFLPLFTRILFHEWYQPALHELKTMSLLIFKASCDRKATFLSFLLTLSVRKALEYRETSQKELITRPITNLMRQQTKRSLCTHNVRVDRLPADFLHPGCVPFETGGTGEGRRPCLKRTLHQSIHMSLCNLFFPSPFPYLCSSIDSPEKIAPHVDVTAPSLRLGEMRTFCFATGQSEFGLTGFAWKQALRNHDFFLPLFIVSWAKSYKALPRW